MNGDLVLSLLKKNLINSENISNYHPVSNLTFVSKLSERAIFLSVPFLESEVMFYCVFSLHIDYFIQRI